MDQLFSAPPEKQFCFPARPMRSPPWRTPGRNHPALHLPTALSHFFRTLSRTPPLTTRCGANRLGRAFCARTSEHTRPVLDVGKHQVRRVTPDAHVELTLCGTLKKDVWNFLMPTPRKSLQRAHSVRWWTHEFHALPAHPDLQPRHQHRRQWNGSCPSIFRSSLSTMVATHQPASC